MPLLQDLLVGGDDVSVRAEHGRDAAVQVAAQELLIAGRLGVDVDDDRPASCPPIRSSMRSAARNGQSTGFM